MGISAQISAAIGQKLLLAFDGAQEPSAEILRAMGSYRPGGVTLFRGSNIRDLESLRKLTGALQNEAQALGLPGLLIAADQEGGQLMAVGDGTPLPGNMALGATGSPDLARLAGEVLGRELSALGINVNYAPSVDVNINPDNPVIGIRSFGENPALVSSLAEALVRGIQSQGVAATAKHFPGHGDTQADSHHGLQSVPHALGRLNSVELPPFQAAINAGVKLVMTAHLALPAIDGPQAGPATLSANILGNLLRDRLKFDGVIVTDAMDMKAIRQGDLLGDDAIRAVNAGADLLLLNAGPEDQRRVFEALVRAANQGTLDQFETLASAARIATLKQWIFSRQETPDLSVVNSHTHQQVAKRIAESAITLVRDRANLIPIRLAPGQRILVITPRPVDLTPADTSSYVSPDLAGSIRAFHPNVDEIQIRSDAPDADICAVMERVSLADLVILGTLNAYQQVGQQNLANRILTTGIPSIIAALRLPYDLAAFPQAPTYLCTYGILEPSLRALAKVLFGEIIPEGKLPVSIPGLYPAGHQLKK